MKVQVLGICRFSLLVEGGFQVEHDSLEARRRMLYDPARLAQRFAWFEHICLPAWRAQTDPDFNLIVATGADFPEPWLGRLRALVAGMAQVVIEQVPPARHRPLCRRVLQRHVDASADVVAQFRHDDDDAVAVDFVARLRGDFTRMLGPVQAAEGMIWVDYARGFTLMTPPEGLDVVPQVAERMTAALAVFLPPDAETCVMDYGHHKLNQVMTGVSFQDSFMYVRGKHGANDSTGAFAHNGARVGCDTPLQTMRDRFAIDLEAFETLLLGQERG